MSDPAPVPTSARPVPRASVSEAHPRSRARPATAASGAARRRRRALAGALAAGAAGRMGMPGGGARRGRWRRGRPPAGGRLWRGRHGAVGLVGQSPPPPGRRRAAMPPVPSSSLPPRLARATPRTLRLALIGDVHGAWSPADAAALRWLAPDAALFVGDFGNEDVGVVKAVASLGKEMPVRGGGVNFFPHVPPPRWFRSPLPTLSTPALRLPRSRSRSATTTPGFRPAPSPRTRSPRAHPR